MSKTFCPLPWVFQSVRTNGDLRICCQADQSESKGILRKENGSAFNAGKDSLTEAMNASILKQTRLDMLAGKDPEPCLRCKREDESGVRSNRVFEIGKCKREFGFDFSQAKKITAEDGSIKINENPLPYYQFDFGNLCNLKCRMCGPMSSTSWYQDYIRINNDSHKFKDAHGTVTIIKKEKGGYTTKNKDYDWIYSDSFWKQIKLQAPHIKRITAVGGEPLLIERHYELLETIIKYGQSDKVEIHYNTNFTVIPEKAISLWKNFRTVGLCLSLDAWGDLNNYIRYPSRFEKVEKNLDKLDKIGSDRLRLYLEVTVQAYNILHLPELLKWKLKKRFKNISNDFNYPPISHHALHDPIFLNVKVLPPMYKKRVEKKFSEFMLWLENWCEEEMPAWKSEKLKIKTQEFLNGYINYMNSEDLSHLIPQFWNYTSRLDKVRKERMRDVLPELYEDIFAWSDLNESKLSGNS